MTKPVQRILKMAHLILNIIDTIVKGGGGGGGGGVHPDFFVKLGFEIAVD